MKKTPLRTAPREFLALTAKDLMTTPVMTIPQETSLREAARLLSGFHVSGAPVVDGEGRCLGVLSSSDFVAWAGTEGETPSTEREVTCFIAPWGEMIDIEECAENEIRRYMTRSPITVAPTASVGEVAQVMVDAHIHRVLVVVEQERPLGVVTSTDILTAVARAARE
jgi:CBS domain-containing protein